MFVLGKFFTYLVLPPGGFVVLIVAIGILAIRCRKITRGLPDRPRIDLAVYAFVVAALLYAASTRPVADMLLSPLEKQAAISRDAATGSSITTSEEGLPEAIVVLGGGAVDARWSGDGQHLADASTQRTISALILHRTTGLPIVVSGGKPLDTNRESEAVTAYRLLIALGAEPGAIIIEDASNNTWENASLVADKIEARRVYLVTSASHMKRSIECFEAFGFEPVPYPSDFRVSDTGYTFFDRLPDAQSLGDTAAALKEYIGRLFYRIRYGSSGYRFTTR